MINPIQVTAEWVLIAGWHRLEACRSLGWEAIDATVLSVDDIEAEIIEISENLFRNELTVLERGQQYKRLKAFYEVKYPETENGQSQALGMNKALNNNVKVESTFTLPSFVADTAAKINKSEAAITKDIQIANNIPERVQAAIKDLPVADNKSDLLKLSRYNETAQNQIADVLQSGKAAKVDDAIRILDTEFKDALPTF